MQNFLRIVSEVAKIKGKMQIKIDKNKKRSGKVNNVSENAEKMYTKRKGRKEVKSLSQKCRLRYENKLKCPRMQKALAFKKKM